MKLANRVPSRVQQLQCLFNKFENLKSRSSKDEIEISQQSKLCAEKLVERKLKKFQSSRQHFITECTQRISKTAPRILLKRVNTKIPRDAVTVTLRELALSSNNVENLSSSTEAEVETAMKNLLNETFGDLDKAGDKNSPVHSINLYDIVKQDVILDAGGESDNDNEENISTVIEFAKRFQDNEVNDDNQYQIDQLRKESTTTEIDFHSKTSLDADDFVNDTFEELHESVIAREGQIDIPEPSGLLHSQQTLLTEETKSFDDINMEADRNDAARSSENAIMKAGKITGIDEKSSNDCNNAAFSKDLESVERDEINENQSCQNYLTDKVTLGLGESDDFVDVTTCENKVLCHFSLVSSGCGEESSKNLLSQEKPTEEPENPGNLKRYNLREKRAALHQHSEVQQNKTFDSDEDLSSLSDSSITSDSEDSFDSNLDEYETVSKDGLTRRSKFRPKQKESTNGSANKYYCKMKGCQKLCFSSKNNFQDHQQMHQLGQYKCNFCEVIEETILNLIRHEQESHRPKTNNDSEFTKNFLHCPRCPFQCQRLIVYQQHFAQTHIEGFQITKRKRKRLGTAQCDICKVYIINRKGHFMQFHDITGVDPKLVTKCKVDGCSAFFNHNDKKRMTMMQRHKLIAHNQSDKIVYHLEDELSSSCGSCCNEDSCDSNLDEKITVKRSKRKRTRVSIKHVQCNICKLKIVNPDEHFKQFHDTSGLDPKLVRKCNVEGCTAFVNHNDQRRISMLRRHKLTVHLQYGKMSKTKHEIPLSKMSREKSYWCPVKDCQKNFPIEMEMENHLSFHGSFKCQFCDEVKEYAPDLARHELQHNMEKIEILSEELSATEVTFKCPRCSGTFQQYSLYCEHHLYQHMQIQKSFCSICSVQFKGGRKWLYVHFITHHNIKGLSGGAAQFKQCDLCPAYFVTDKQLEIHKIKHFNKQCPECGRKFQLASNLKRHMETIHKIYDTFPNKVYICDVGDCKKRFATEEKLSQHKMQHQNKVVVAEPLVKCSKCEKEFLGKYRLNAHLKNYHGTASYVCDECGKSFKKKDHLNRHMEYHKGSASWRYQCSTCGRKFADNYKLKQHNRTHTLEKLFVCQLCGEKYAHNHNLRNHLKKVHERV